jgi:hypothetical protein
VGQRVNMKQCAFRFRSRRLLNAEC